MPYYLSVVDRKLCHRCFPNQKNKERWTRIYFVTPKYYVEEEKWTEGEMTFRAVTYDHVLALPERNIGDFIDMTKVKEKNLLDGGFRL
jgi:hypothetical protein